MTEQVLLDYLLQLDVLHLLNHLDHHLHYQMDQDLLRLNGFLVG